MTSNAAVGHFTPLAPTVRALMDAGHDVLVAVPASFAETVKKAGFRVAPCVEKPVQLSVPEPPPPAERDARLVWGVTQSWPSDARSWMDALLDVAGRWRPDVVVVEPVEHAGRLAAAALGVPLVEHGWGFTLAAGLAEEGVASLRDAYVGLGIEPARAALRVDLGARSVQADDIHPVARYRYRPWSYPGLPLPDHDGRRRVLVTLGTYDNPDAAERIRIVIGAAHDAGAQVIGVLGNRDRRSVAALPAGVVPLDWIDMPAAVATCDLVAHHGGAGTSWATLCAGRPALITPQMGDQFRNAALLTYAGVATTILPEELDQSRVRAAIETLLTDPGPALAAAMTAAENAALPDVDHLAADIARAG